MELVDDSDFELNSDSWIVIGDKEPNYGEDPWGDFFEGTLDQFEDNFGGNTMESVRMIAERHGCWVLFFDSELAAMTARALR
jgi:hypothetical protein